MTKENNEELLKLLEELHYRNSFFKRETFFPAEGPYRRDLYTKHLSFFKHGATHSERAFIAGNRIGKTAAGAFEMSYHLTGLYPDWWEGKRFKKPVSAWAASITNESTRDYVQVALFGSLSELGTGMIPKDYIGNTHNRPGVPNAIGWAQVKHFDDSGEFDGWSEIGIKSYIQGWETFQGTKKDVIWLDEEPEDQKIYFECLLRTGGDVGDTGIIYCTFTPLHGLSDVVLSFLPQGKFPEGYIKADGTVVEPGQHPELKHKFIVKAGWNDIPHLSNEWKEKQLQNLPPHEKGPRVSGEPNVGAGAIYPIPESEIVVEPFEIPYYWPRAYGLDVGWNKTAAVWAAQDPSDKCIYLYSEHYGGKSEPVLHATAIKARGAWIPGVIDPKANNSSSTDGIALLTLYMENGLLIAPANNAVEPGLLKTWTLLSTGQLKVFKTLNNWLTEYRMYHRDVNGKIVKRHDHLMDATRYLVMSGLDLMDTAPDPDADQDNNDQPLSGSSFTGY